MRNIRRPAASTISRLMVSRGPLEIAKRVGATEGGVRSHASGRVVPRKEIRERYRDRFGIPLADWELGPAPSVPPVPGSVPPPAAAPPLPPGFPPPTGTPDALVTVVSLLHTTQQQLTAAQADVDVPYAAKATLITSATRLCQLLAKLTGSLEVTQSMICRSAAWGRMLRTFETVFARHPEAALALAEFAKELAEMGE